MKKLKLFIITTLLFSTSLLYSQGKTNFHIGPTFPMADFGDDDTDNEKALGAGIGIGLGIEYIYPLNDNGLGLFAGFDINYNPMKSDVKDEIVDIFSSISSGEIDEDDITFNKYFNIPISVGLNYTYKADEKLSIYGNFGLVANFLKITDLTVDFQGDEITSEYDLASSFGTKIGGGIILNDKTYISLNYFGLGKHKINVETTTSGDLDDNSNKVKFKSKVNMLTLTIGFRL
ncbi:MAG TPA: hypothetical protein EYG89_05130 [Bacteroidia bacterium]|nr:hypothetical protein [Bacteroidia bacterium]